MQQMNEFQVWLLYKLLCSREKVVNICTRAIRYPGGVDKWRKV